MKYPVLPVGKLQKQTVSVFKGLSCAPRMGEGQLAAMKNLTSRHYPVLSPRACRGSRPDAGKASGLIAKDSLCWVEGREFVINGVRVDMDLTPGQKQLVSMGAYVVIFPDKMWINTMAPERFGSMEASFDSDGDVRFLLCDGAGEALADPEVSRQEPEEPENGMLWLEPVSGSLCRYSQSSGWVPVEGTCVKICAPGIGRPFSQGDGVTLSGIRVPGLEALNTTGVIRDLGEDYILFPGSIPAETVQLAAEGPVKLRRQVPEMDFVVEAGNRLWGCRYGPNGAGNMVNEIYASRLGDFKNWNCFQGISTDSWAASLGSDGPFTGAITYMGYPLFFKENVLHKVYISDSGAHGIRETACRGVQAGCGGSLALGEELLFYRSRDCICMYDGSLPEEVSEDLRLEPCVKAAGGTIGDKYYISMENARGQWELLVYDLRRKLWHREDDLGVEAFCACRGELFAQEAGTGRVLTMLGSGEPVEEKVSWMAETGDLGVTEQERRYLQRLQLSLFLPLGSQLRVSARYDNEEHWTPLCSLRGTGMKQFSLPVRPRRCGKFRLRLEGEGPGFLYAICRKGEKGSDSR